MIKSSTFDTLDKSLSHHDFDLPRAAGPALRGRVTGSGCGTGLWSQVAGPVCGARFREPVCVARLRRLFAWPRYWGRLQFSFSLLDLFVYISVFSKLFTLYFSYLGFQFFSISSYLPSYIFFVCLSHFISTAYFLVRTISPHMLYLCPTPQHTLSLSHTKKSEIKILKSFTKFRHRSVMFCQAESRGIYYAFR